MIPPKVGSIWKRHRQSIFSDNATVIVTDVKGPDVYFFDEGNPLAGKRRLQVGDFCRVFRPFTSLERFLDGCED